MSAGWAGLLKKPVRRYSKKNKACYKDKRRLNLNLNVFRTRY